MSALRTSDTKQGEPTELGSTAHTQDRAQSGPDRAERSSAEAAAPPPIAHPLPDLGGGDAAAPLSAPEDAIADLNALSRAFRLLGAARSRIAEIELTAQRERERIDEWEHTATERDRDHITLLEQSIAAYARARRDDTDGRDKSLSTPWGLVETRAQEDEFIRDDATLLPWAESHGYIREKVTRELDWKRLKADLIPHAGGVCLLAGDVVPGIVHRAREPKVTVTPWE